MEPGEGENSACLLGIYAAPLGLISQGAVGSSGIERCRGPRRDLPAADMIVINNELSYRAVKKEQQAKERASRASATLSTFALAEGVFLLGSLERGVTVYSQQIRAHNLAWALWEVDKEAAQRPMRVAIVGGGIGGLTAAGCFLSLFPKAQVCLFERSWDLCALQQGCDSRWLHPRIYDWPQPESRFPSAALPVLDWSGGRASDVADQILRGFGRHCDSGSPARGSRFAAYVGVGHLKIATRSREIQWVGRVGEREGIFFRAGAPTGGTDRFDVIVVAIGFGREDSGHATSYWQNDNYGEPILDGSVRPCFISGYGDGALVDLCRVTIERFRQDRIVYDLFGNDIERLEQRFVRLLADGAGVNLYDLLRKAEGELLGEALKHLKTRIRKDTRVVLHLSGRDEKNKELRDVFGGTSSVLNRVLLYMLFRCGAFVPNFEAFDAASRVTGPRAMLIRRHGPDSMAHLYEIFMDVREVADRLVKIRYARGQTPTREWTPGSFPI